MKWMIVVAILSWSSVAYSECRIIEYPDHNEAVCDGDSPRGDIAQKTTSKNESTHRMRIKSEQAERALNSTGRLLSKCLHGIPYKDFKSLYPDTAFEINLIKNRLAPNEKQFYESISEINDELFYASTLWDWKFRFEKVTDCIYSGQPIYADFIKLYGESSHFSPSVIANDPLREKQLADIERRQILTGEVVGFSGSNPNRGQCLIINLAVEVVFSSAYEKYEKLASSTEFIK
jgi:hypothetical protein